VVSLKVRDEAARRRARRTYVRILLNDFVLNPGSGLAPLALTPNNDDDENFGLMTPFVRRWRARLPEALALGAGSEVRIPPGNAELMALVEQYRSDT
jgi:hypothetical protein